MRMQLVRSIMDEAAAAGLNLVRAWAHASSPEYALQPSPGRFSEPVFRGLDYALDQARRRGLKVLLSFVNNWGTTGGVDGFVAWSPTASAHQHFFTDAGCRAMYRASVAAVISRVNSINGRRYRDDPTIFGWNLINEPRCSGCGTGPLQDWIMEMAQYVKSLDPNHLLSVGAEGFYAHSAANPGGATSWAANEGQDFVLNNNVAGIDFATFHCWPDNWLDDGLQFQTAWVRQHAADAAKLGKPIAPAAEGGGAGLYGVRSSDAVFGPVRQFAQAMNRSSTQVMGCVDNGRQAGLPPVNECRGTWVGDRPGTGCEGARCDTDINECVRGTSGCALNAGCINSAGWYSCSCHWGHTGDGYTSCSPGLQLAGLSGSYESDGPSRVACSQGADVVYPEGAPGFAYDPIGDANTPGSPHAGGMGSLRAVSVQDCQVACEMAQLACTSFAYNAVMAACFLKRGGGRATCISPTSICTEQAQDLVVQHFSCGSWETYFRMGTSDHDLTLG